MDFFEVIAKRHSYRGTFQEASIPQEDIDKILLAGIQAPSGYNQQTTSFVVVTEPALRRQIAEILPTQAVKTAPVLLVPISERVVFANDLAFEVEDDGAAVENVLLAITALGYASVWMDGDVKQNGAGEKIAALLHIPTEKKVRAVLPLGIPTEVWQQKEKKPLAERVHFNAF